MITQWFIWAALFLIMAIYYKLKREFEISGRHDVAITNILVAYVIAIVAGIVSIGAAVFVVAVIIFAVAEGVAKEDAKLAMRRGDTRRHKKPGKKIILVGEQHEGA